MTSEKVTTREAQRLATRERLFRAAVAEFKQTGVADADVAAIVESAGVAHGTFFFHFPTKEHVVAELGQREEVRMAGELERFLAPPRDLKATLAEVVRHGDVARASGRHSAVQGHARALLLADPPRAAPVARPPADRPGHPRVRARP